VPERMFNFSSHTRW